MPAWPLAPLTNYVVGTVVPPTDLNSIQFAINGVYGATQTLKALQVDGTGANAASVAAGNILASGTIQSQTAGARGKWLSLSAAIAQSGWTFSAGNPPRWSAAGSGNVLLIPIPLVLQTPYVGGTSIVQTISSIAARIIPNGSGVMTLQAMVETQLSTTNNPLTSQIGSTASSSGSSHQTITVTPSNYFPTNDQYCYAQLTAAQASDAFYGLFVTYTTVVF